MKTLNFVWNLHSIRFVKHLPFTKALMSSIKATKAPSLALGEGVWGWGQSSSKTAH